MTDSTKNDTPVQKALLTAREIEAPRQDSVSRSAIQRVRVASSRTPQATKTAYRKLTVSCIIDSALKEIGSLGKVALDEEESSGATSAAPTIAIAAANSAPLNEIDLYGYGPTSASEPTVKLCPELKLRGRIGRPRYQRRGSVTKYSLGNALAQVQKEVHEGFLQEQSPTKVGLGPSSSATDCQLWHQLYSSSVDDRPIKRSSFCFQACGGIRPLVAGNDGRTVKRRRAMF